MNTKTSMEPCSVPSQANRVAEGISDLIRVWADAATDLTVGSARIMAGTVENLSQSSCGIGQRAADAKREGGARGEERPASDLCGGFSESISICTSGTTQLSGLGARSAEPTCITLTSVCRPLTDACDTGARGNTTATKTDAHAHAHTSAAKTEPGSASTTAAAAEPSGKAETVSKPNEPTKSTTKSKSTGKPK